MKCIDDYINGNLTDAKKGAKRVRGSILRQTLMEEYGKSLAASVAITDFLKGEGTFQAACDAEYSSK